MEEKPAENRGEAGAVPDWPRRVLLGAVTALIVARTLVPGDDPGRLQRGTGVAGLGLVFLWFLAATGWGIWRAWSREGAWRGSLIEVGLLVFVGISFYSANEPNRYGYPGWMISWEWVGVFTAFCLVRQLFRGEQENNGLLAALLATGVSLAAVGLLQSIASPPLAEKKLDPTVARILGVEDEAPAETPALRGPFARATTLAGFLLLLLPALGIAAAIHFRAVGPARRFGPIGLTLLGLAAVAVALVTIAHGNFSREPFRAILDSRLDAWATTSTIIREHPWWGVGPGNFSREYPAFLTSAAQQKITEPPSFPLEIAANYGLLGLAALLATIALFFGRTIPAMASGRRRKNAERRTPNAERQDQSAVASRSPRTAWEFYLGGMAGLTLGFMLRFDPTGGGSALAAEAVAALIRFVIWFGVFALCERLPWTNRARLAAASMGVAALLVFLLFNPGFGFPSLAVPLWAMAALALNATPSPTWRPRHWIGMVLPAPLLGVLCLLFLVAVFYPAASAAARVADAQRFYPTWREQVEPRWRKKLEEKSSPEEKLAAVRAADRNLKKFILDPLEHARELERGNAYHCTELAFWYAKEWQLQARLKEFENNKVQYLVRKRQGEVGQQAIGAAAGGYEAGTEAKGARELDPKGPEVWWALYAIRVRFAEESDKARVQAEQYRMAASNLLQLVERDPTDPRLRLLLAETLAKTRQKDDDAEATKQLHEALRLDAEAGDGPRGLSEVQRANLNMLLGNPGG